jgi:preprotein translocase subunit SecE
MPVATNPPAAPAPSLAQRMLGFYQGVLVELRKVTWPDLKQVQSATIAIIIFVLILALVISILDTILRGLLVNLVPRLFMGT